MSHQAIRSLAAASRLPVSSLSSVISRPVAAASGGASGLSSAPERTTQVFHIGPAAVAVPGMPAGLATAHRRYARLPWAELLAPAVELARAGVPLNSGQAFLHEILDVILRSEPEGRRIYGGDGHLVEGERVVMDDLAGTLEWLAAEGAEEVFARDVGVDGGDLRPAVDRRRGATRVDRARRRDRGRARRRGRIAHRAATQHREHCPHRSAH